MAQEYTQQQITEITTEAIAAARVDILAEGRQQGREEGITEGSSDLIRALSEFVPKVLDPGGKKGDFTKGASACRKPDPYREGEDIIKYISSFENYRKIAGIPDHAATRIFLTYLDASSQSKLADLSSDLKDKWKEARDVIRNRLQQSQLPYQSRAKLHRAKQQSNESVDKFIGRITDLGNKAFKNKEEATMRDQAILDALMSGLRSSHITMLIFAKHGENLDLATTKTEARLLEAANEVRRDQDIDDEEGVILQIKEQPQGSQDPPKRGATQL